MAKRTYKILRFDGGINNDADPRDIGDNQFADLQNVAVDEMGKIIVLGDANTSYKTLSGAISAEGRGLISVSTDYAGLLSSGASTDKIYYLVENGTSIQGISSDGSETGTALTSTGITDPTYYYVDGGLRIGEGSHGSSSTPKLRSYIKGATYGNNVNSSGTSKTTADAVIATGWTTTDAEIKGVFPTWEYYGVTKCRNAIIVNTPDNVNPSSYYPGFTFAGGLTDGKINFATGAITQATGGPEWGVALTFDEDNGGNGTGTWMPQSDTRYQFHITTMYDNMTQESLPQILTTFDSRMLHSGSVGTYVGKTQQRDMLFTDGDSQTVGENVAVRFRPIIKFNGDSTDNFNFGGADEVAVTGGNPRISGCRIYWSSSEDGNTTLWQMMELDFVRGVKPVGADGGSGGTSGHSPWYAYQHNATGSTAQHQSPEWTIGGSREVKWTNPPRYFQYDVFNGHSYDEVINIDSFKTAIVANRRVYIGNVEQNGVIQGDRMLKSPVNQFDKFPSINNIDVAINDGDEIIALVEYADRILQFKKNTCYIINVSGSAEYLEAEHRYKGISNPGAACRTDYGCAWVNQDGCFLYDGQQVTDLLEDQGMRKIQGSTWSAFIGTDSEDRIGFHKAKRQLIVKGTSTDAYIYDMVTKSWTRGTSSFDLNTNSNFINDLKDGKLLIHDGSGSLDRWNSAPTAGKAIVIETKDIDFGEPAVKKKLYKIYVTYKGDGSSITENYRTNGGTTDYGFDAGFGNVSVWTRLELKPDTASEAKSIYSCQLRLTGSCATNFMINDISFIYRTKGIK